MSVAHHHHDRPALLSIWRGLQRRCPACGQGKAFRSYLKPVDSCRVCETALGQIRADDFPPYLTIFLVGHIVVPLVLLTEQRAAWSMTLQMIVWPSVTLVLSLLFLPLLKGGVVGLMWALRLRGGDEQALPSGDVRPSPRRSGFGRAGRS